MSSLQRHRSGGDAFVPAPDLPGPHLFRPSLELTYRGHRSTVLAAGFQPASSALTDRRDSTALLPPYTLSAGADGLVFLWSAKPTVRALRFTGHRGPVHDCAWSPHAHLVASAGHDGFVRLWLPLLRRGFGGASSIPSKTSFGGDNCSLWRAHTGPVRAVAFAPQDDWLFTAGDDKSVKCWDLNYAVSSSPSSSRGGGAHGANGNKFVCGFTGGHQNWIRTVAVSSGGAASGPIASRVSLVASGGDDRIVQVWDTRSRRPTHTFYEHTGAVRSVDFHPDGCSIATGSADQTINIFDLRRNRLLQHYNAHTAVVHEVRFAPTGSWLLSASGDGTVKLWDLKEGYLYCTLNAHEGAVHTARFADTGAHFTTAGQDGIVMVWRSGLPRNIPPPPPPLQQQQQQQQQQQLVYENAQSDRHMQSHLHKVPAQQPQQNLDGMETGVSWNQTTPPYVSVPVPLQSGSMSFPTATDTTSCATAKHAQDLCCSIETSAINESSHHVPPKPNSQSAAPMPSTSSSFRPLRQEQQQQQQQGQGKGQSKKPNQPQVSSSSPSNGAPLHHSSLLQKPPIARPPIRSAARGLSSIPSTKTRDTEEVIDAGEREHHNHDCEGNHRPGPPVRGCEKDVNDSNELVSRGTYTRMEDEWRYPLSRTTHLTSEDDLHMGNKKTGQSPPRVEAGDDHKDGSEGQIGEIDEDELSVVEYVVGSAYDPKGHCRLVHSEELKDSQTPHGELDDRMRRLEEAYTQLAMETYKSQERNSTVVRQIREQWDTQQRQQRGEMDQLRKMMESLVEQQNKLMQAVLRRES